MGDIYKDCYQCGKNCINTQFCADGGSFDSSSLQLPRSLKIRVVANPDFWGFGTVSGNTLIEGWGTFTNGYFDFFDGFDEEHSSLKICGETTTGPYINEQRPDVGYRSVYDPENGDKHYANGSEDGIVRGGAEGYLLDRSGSSSDGASCDTTNPINVFKYNPAGYGTFPKILFQNKIYKNITGAWRIEECSGCYSNTPIENDFRVYDCSGNAKQHIVGDDKFSSLYDPFQNRCIADGFTGESGCNPDGTVAAEYAGTLSSIVRDTGTSPFLQYTFQYNGGVASGLFNGKSVGIDGMQDHNGTAILFDVTHNPTNTTAYAVGTQGGTNYTDTSNGNWTLFGSYDPNTCCGGAAYGVTEDLMNIVNAPLYHVDIGRVFNNPKNKIYSNRIDRTYNELTVEPEVPDGTSRQDYTYVAVNESGYGLLVESGAIHEVELACETGIWSPTGDYIYKLNGEYSVASGIGAEALSTDSGFYPLFPKQMPYFGRFDDADRWDNTQRQSSDGTREVNKNATCYTKTGSLTVYPDCLTQWARYTNCDPKTKYDLINVPRIAIVYRGCDFNDPCTFDDSGRPWTAGASGHPSGMNDLIRGFGGQEIQMFVNLGTARAAEIKREPCCCEPPPCPGTSPPEFIQVPSPVTFPCFPKFDLYPSGYGCQDPLYYLNIMDKLGLNTDPGISCETPFYDACTPVQPYTTYGYMRNLCGKETNSRRDVIDSLSEKLHTGDYDDLNYTDSTVEPMYVAFEQDEPDCCSPSGFPNGSEECDPGLDFTTYGSGASGELIVDATGGITFNITAEGSGYAFGGGVLAIPSATLSPEQRFGLTFGTAQTGLSQITATPASGSPFNTTIPLTIVAGGSGVAGSGGFTYDDCPSEGTVHYWGITDYQGRLALPYFRTKPGDATLCGKPVGSYIDYSETGTIVKGWPKDKVPFLVEIDHEEYCSSCETTQMPTGNLNLTIESLNTEYLHGLLSQSNSHSYKINGWTHNKFPGTTVTPIYNASTDTWIEDYCSVGDGLSFTYGQPNTGDTCECASGLSVTMVPRTLKGSNAPIGYSTSGSIASDGSINSYLPFNNCGLAGLFDDRGPDSTNTVLANHTVYMNASIGCASFYADAWNNGGVFFPDDLYDYGGNGLEDIYGCNGKCATSFPAVNNAPPLRLDYWFVADRYRDIFELMSDKAIYNNEDLLKFGLICTPVIGRWEDQSNEVVCGNETGNFNSFTRTNLCDEITTTSPDSVEDYLQLTHCINGNKGKVSANFNVTPCIGSRIVVYSCSHWKKGEYNRYHGNSNGKFGGLCSFNVDFLPSEEPLLSQSIVNGCITPISNPTGTLPVCMETRADSYIDPIRNALLAASGGDVSAYQQLRWGCHKVDSGVCCTNVDIEADGFTVGVGPYKPYGMTYGNRFDMYGCECEGFDNMDIAYDMTFSPLINPVTGFSGNYWVGDVLFPQVTPGNCDNSLPQYYWSGENLPGIGNIGPLPVGEPMAYRYYDTDSIPINGWNSIEVENFCDYHTGPNRYAYVGAELFEPFRPDGIDVDLGVGPNLVPETCVNNPEAYLTSENSFYSTCGTPVPFDTYSGGIGTGIRVNKKACWPEVMTVHKIECETSGYKLHVSREYFEHNRNWYVLGAGPAGATVVRRLGLIDGGETSARYSCEETYPVSCADPGTGMSPTNLPTYFALNMMTPTDSVSPVYPDLCATGTEPFFKTDTSTPTFKFGSHTTSEEHPSGCLYYPAISGEQFWNFYNLLYDSGDPSSIYYSDAGGGAYEIPPDPDADCNESFPHNLALNIAGDLDPVFTSESQIRSAHSCIQDFPECGGDLWCNKEFFPRKSYKKNTRLTRFAALSICEQTSEFESAGWYEGHETTWDESPNKTILATGPFVDACDNNAAVLLSSGIGIDDNILHIPFLNQGGTSPSIETLMGIIHPGFKSNVNEKTCIYADDGECLSYLPEHNDRSIQDITFSPDEYGYYLNDLVSSGEDNCLFTPFKIMVDVECCPDRIGHKGTSDPTLLNYIAKIPASVCEGWTNPPVCSGCGVGFSECDFKSGPYFPGLGCVGFRTFDKLSDATACQIECVEFLEDYDPNGSKSMYLVEQAADTIIDPKGGDPLDAMTLVSSGQYYSIFDNPNCQEICGPLYSLDDVEQTGSFIPEFNYEPNATLDSGNIYSFKGNLYRIAGAEFGGDLDYFDKTDYQGSGYTFEGASSSFSNCCSPSGTPGLDYFNNNPLNGGCDCEWEFCEFENLRSLPTGVDFIGTIGTTPISVVDDQFNNTFGCVPYSSIETAYYPSVVKLTITEA